MLSIFNQFFHKSSIHLSLFQHSSLTISKSIGIIYLHVDTFCIYSKNHGNMPPLTIVDSPRIILSSPSSPLGLFEHLCLSFVTCSDSDISAYVCIYLLSVCYVMGCYEYINYGDEHSFDYTRYFSLIFEACTRSDLWRLTRDTVDMTSVHV